MEEDVAAVEGVDKGGEVGDVAIGELESGVGGREGAEVAAPPHEGPYDVALLEEPVAEAATEVAGRSRHQHFHHFLIDGGRVGHRLVKSQKLPLYLHLNPPDFFVHKSFTDYYLYIVYSFLFFKVNLFYTYSRSYISCLTNFTKSQLYFSNEYINLFL